MSTRLLDLAALASLLSELQNRSYEVFGPQVRNGVITHERLDSVDQLPVGWSDEQSGGSYRLTRRDDSARFGYAVGPQSWKRLLFPPRSKVWTISRRTGSGSGEAALDVAMHEPGQPRRAFFGVRPCELAAIGKQDRVLLEGPYPDPNYDANRTDLFIVAVACGDPAATCFCSSMGTGPTVGPGADLALTELVSGEDVHYTAEALTPIGSEVLASIPSTPASAGHEAAARRVTDAAADRMTRRLDTAGIRDLVLDNLDSSQWDDLAERCLACGNCTLACPTCFCSDLEDVTDLTGDHTDRWRVWDSCFSLDFSHLGPGPERASIASRYRQWFSHKLASWIDQFDESGCVGCGRCITWCPVGIDLTEEVRIMRNGSTV